MCVAMFRRQRKVRNRLATRFEYTYLTFYHPSEGILEASMRLLTRCLCKHFDEIDDLICAVTGRWLRYKYLEPSHWPRLNERKR